MFAAAPIMPATQARFLEPHTSLTSATPSAHSPPIPSEATNRSAANCQAEVTNPQRPVNTAKVMMARAIALTRPSLSPSHPNSTPPVAAPTRKTAMMMVNHCPWTAAVESGRRSCSAGRPIRGKSPISNPSKSHPRKAARRAA